MMSNENKFNRSAVEPGKLGGKAGLWGLRLSVARVVDLLNIYPDRNESLFRIKCPITARSSASPLY
jgi:uncharacterized protein (DUF433 family)